MGSPARFPYRLALTVPWWIRWRDVAPVQPALLSARALHMGAVIDAAVRRNRAGGRVPGSFRELAEMLHRDAVNVWRWRKGQHEPSVSDVLCLAAVLGVPVGELFPSPVDSVATATHILCDRAIDSTDAALYSEYRSVPARTGCGQLDPDVVRALVTRPGRSDVSLDAAHRSIWKVATHLEPILQRVATREVGSGGRDESG